MQTIVVKSFSSPGNAFNIWQLTRDFTDVPYSLH